MPRLSRAIAVAVAIAAMTAATVAVWTVTGAVAIDADERARLASAVRGALRSGLDHDQDQDHDHDQGERVASPTAPPIRYPVREMWFYQCERGLGESCTPGSQEPADCCNGDGMTTWCGADTPGYPLNPSESAAKTCKPSIAAGNSCTFDWQCKDSRASFVSGRNREGVPVWSPVVNCVFWVCRNNY